MYQLLSMYLITVDYNGLVNVITLITTWYLKVTIDNKIHKGYFSSRTILSFSVLQMISYPKSYFVSEYTYIYKFQSINKCFSNNKEVLNEKNFVWI